MSSSSARIGIATLIAVLAFLLAAGLATQFVAWQFGFQRALGHPWFVSDGLPIYAPFDYFKWRDLYATRYPEPFATAGIFVLAGAILGPALAINLLRGGGLRNSANTQKDDGWSRRADIKRAGLLSGAGMVLGQMRGAWSEEILTYNGSGHVLALGATRSGKGRGIVVPTILNWPGSLVVLDPKGELAAGDPRLGFTGTSGFRAQFSHIQIFAPASTSSARYNPLLEVRRGANEVRDVQNIVDILTAPPEASRETPFWRNAASTLLVGLILDVLYSEAEEHKTFAAVLSRLSRLDEVAEEMRTRLHPLDETTYGAHPKVKEAADFYLGMEPRTRSNVLATAMSYLTLFQDPLVSKNTAASDFRLGDLVALERPVTLYLQMPPSDAGRLMPLFRIMLGQIMRALTETLSHDPLGRMKKHKLLFVLDEFPQLGLLPGFERMLGIMAGYGMQAMLVCQSVNHIKGVYGRDNVIIDNCDVTTSFTINDPDTAEVISAYAGEVWRSLPQLTQHDSRKAFEPDRRSITMREEKRPLLLGSEAMRLPSDQMLIFAGDCKPIRARKLRFDQSDLFKSRLLPPVTTAGPLTTDHDWRGLQAATEISPVAPVAPGSFATTAQSIEPASDGAEDSRPAARSKGI